MRELVETLYGIAPSGKSWKVDAYTRDSAWHFDDCLMVEVMNGTHLVCSFRDRGTAFLPLEGLEFHIEGV